jgi:hypothetical protein
MYSGRLDKKNRTVGHRIGRYSVKFIDIIWQAIGLVVRAIGSKVQYPYVILC